MTFYQTSTMSFCSNDIFAHWREEDVRIAEEWAHADKCDDIARAFDENDFDAIDQYHAEGLVDDVLYALALYGCSCRRCRKFDPAGCVKLHG